MYEWLLSHISWRGFLFVTKERKKPLPVMFVLYYVTGMVFMYFLATCGIQHHDYILVRL